MPQRDQHRRRLTLRRSVLSATLCVVWATMGCSAASHMTRAMEWEERWNTGVRTLDATCGSGVSAEHLRELPLPPWLVGSEESWVAVIEPGDSDARWTLVPTVSLIVTADGLLAYQPELRTRWFDPNARLNVVFNERPIWRRTNPRTASALLRMLEQALDTVDTASTDEPSVLIVARRAGQSSAMRVPVSALAIQHDVALRVHALAAPELTYSRTPLFEADRRLQRDVARHFITWYVEPAGPATELRCLSPD